MAVTLIVPETVAPFAGVVSETVGGVVSAGEGLGAHDGGLRRVVPGCVSRADGVVVRGVC